MRRLYLGVAAASAVASFLAAPLLVRERPRAPSNAVDETAPLEKRFPEHAAAWKLPAREDARWRESRGHAFSVQDRDETERDDDPRWVRVFSGLPKVRPQPAACLGCHASIDDARRPIGCADCHEPRTAGLRVTRAAFLEALKPAMRPTHQEMRSYVCAQCHAEYFLEGPDGKAAFPWARGLKVEDIEAFYDDLHMIDWRHAETGAGLVRVRHPQFEMWRRGMHARNGVACSDCHMGPLPRGAARISDHHLASPLDRLPQACARCHALPDAELKARVAELRARYADLEARALDAMTGLLDDVYAARSRGAAESELEPVRRYQRRAMLRIGFAADGSKGFHAPAEAARLLAEAIDFARRGQIAATKAGAQAHANAR